MKYTADYRSPLGKILLTADDMGLTGLWFYGAKNFPKIITPVCRQNTSVFLSQAKEWLDIYFSGRRPEFTPDLHMEGSEFQKEVWKMLLQIPYRKTVTYGEIASSIASKRNIKKMSAQAVGGAVGKNKIAIIVPCHRVVGANGKLTGYSGGMDKKIKLLQLEKADISSLFV